MASASADLPDDVATLQALLIAARAETAAHLLMIEKLKAQLAKLRRMQFGQSSEKLDAAIHQLELALEDVEEVEDLLSQAGGVSVEGPLRSGRSRLRVESGSLAVTLTPGASVAIRGEAKLGKINWPDGGDKVDEYVVGNGAARLDIAVVMGMATVKSEA